LPEPPFSLLVQAPKPDARLSFNRPAPSKLRGYVGGDIQTPQKNLANNKVKRNVFL